MLELTTAAISLKCSFACKHHHRISCFHSLRVFSLGTVLANCSVTRPALVVNGDTVVIYFTTGHNHFVSSQSYLCHCAFLVCTTWHDVIDSHAWLADAQVPTTRHPVPTTTANLLDLALVLIDEGLDVGSCTQPHRFQVSVIRCNKKVSTCSRD